MKVTNGNQVSRLVEKSIKCLEEACTELESAGTPGPIEALTSVITRIQAVSQVHLADLSNTPPIKVPKRHALEPAFYRLWHNRFPKYGNPSRTDRAEVGRMFKDVISVVYPQANEAFLERAMDHFIKSSVRWVRENRELHVLAKNFRKFVNGPVADGDNENVIAAPQSRFRPIV